MDRDQPNPAQLTARFTVHGMTAPKGRDALFDVGGTTGPGPVYQGVCAQIRHLFPKDDTEATTRKAAMAGTIAQARSIAASIDRHSGHGGGYQANGVPLATMHAQLDALLDRLAGNGTTDPFQDLLNELGRNDPTEDHRASAAEASHPAE